jgi:hypothetical protein
VLNIFSLKRITGINLYCCILKLGLSNNTLLRLLLFRIMSFKLQALFPAPAFVDFHGRERERVRDVDRPPVYRQVRLNSEVYGTDA